MKGKKYRIALFLMLALLPQAAWPAFQDPYWSARVAALGGAYTAVSDDVVGTFYNTAGIVQAQERQANFTYARLFAGVNEVKLSLNQFSYLQPMGKKGRLGVGWGRFDSADLYTEDTVIVGYAYDLASLLERVEYKGKLSIGVSARYLRRKFTLDARSAGDPVFRDGSQKQAGSFDVHVYAEPDLVEGLRVGLSVKNINRPDISFQDGERLPAEVTGGLAYKWKNVLVPVDVTNRSGELKGHVGTEVKLMEEKLALRIGSDKDQVGSGVGYEYRLKDKMSLAIDYTFLWPFELSNSAGSHRASVSARF